MPSDSAASGRFSKILINRGFLQNPLLVQALGLCPVAGGAVSLQAGLVLSVTLTAAMMLNLLATHFLLKKLPRWLRMPAYVLVALAAVGPAAYVLETYAQTLLSSVGIYLALLAVSSLISVRCEKTFVKCGLKQSFFAACAECAGYTAVILAVSLIRELAGSGTLWGRTVTTVYFAPGLLLPFGGFLTLGFLAALHRGFVARHFALRGVLKDITFDLSAAAGPLKQPPTPAPAITDNPAQTQTPPASAADETPAEEIRTDEARSQAAREDTEAPEGAAPREPSTNMFTVAPFTQLPHDSQEVQTQAESEGEMPEQGPVEDSGAPKETPVENTQPLPGGSGESDAAPETETGTHEPPPDTGEGGEAL